MGREAQHSARYFTLQFGVWTFRNGKIVNVVWFAMRAEALEAAGLSE